MTPTTREYIKTILQLFLMWICVYVFVTLFVYGVVWLVEQSGYVPEAPKRECVCPPK